MRPGNPFVLRRGALGAGGRALLAADAAVDCGEVRFALGRPEGIGGGDVRVLAVVVVVLVHEPAAPPAVFAPMRAPAGDRLHRLLPEPEVRPVNVA